jgi:hypothetical protein
MKGVDKADKYLSYYSDLRKTVKWQNVSAKLCVMGCGGPPNHRHHYLKRVSFGQHHDVYVIYNIFYNTTPKCTNIVTSKQNTITQSKFKVRYKVLPQHKDYNFLSRNCHKEAWSPPAALHFIPSITQPINLEYKLIKHPNETKCNPNHFTHFNLAPNNLITLTWHRN